MVNRFFMVAPNALQRHASRSAPRAWQKEANIAQLPNTYNGTYEALRSASQNPEPQNSQKEKVACRRRRLAVELHRNG